MNIFKGTFNHTKNGQSLLPLLSVQFIFSLGLSIALPFLIFLVVRFKGNELLYGFLGATYSAFQFIGSPMIGRWSDNIGRRKALLYSQAGTAFAWLIFLIALFVPITDLFETTLPSGSTLIFTIPLLLLFLARGFDGLTGGNISVANAYLADITTDKHRKSNFGLMGSAMNLGFILGPALAGLLGSTPLEEIVPVSLTLMVSLAGLAFIYFGLKEPVSPCKKYITTEADHTNKILNLELKDCIESAQPKTLSIRETFALPIVPLMVVLYFLIFLGFNFFYVSFPLMATQLLMWDVTTLGLFFSTMAFLLICVQGPLLNYLSSRVADKTLMLVGSALLVIFFFTLVLADQSVIFYSIGLFALGNGLLWPSFSSYLSQIAGPKQQGAVQGVAQSAGSLAAIVGLLGGGIVYSYVGKEVFMIAGSILALVFIVIALRLRSLDNLND